MSLIEHTDAVSGEKVIFDTERRLTKENVVQYINDYVKDKTLSGDLLMRLSFCMEFAISTKDLDCIKAVHKAITFYFLDL